MKDGFGQQVLRGMQGNGFHRVLKNKENQRIKKLDIYLEQSVIVFYDL